jgi:hypothetical protein
MANKQNVAHYELDCYEIIPSTGRYEGWQNYLTARSSGFAPATADALKEIHQLQSGSITLALDESLEKSLMRELYTLDRPDGYMKQKLAEVTFLGGNSITKILNIYGPNGIGDYIRYVLTVMCEQNTEVQYNPVIVGDIRCLGTRKINGYDPELVYLGHACTFGEGVREQFETAAGTPTLINPEAYYGLTLNLHELYTALCVQYDRLMDQAQGIDDVLMAEAFLGFVGTRILHPFADGNGRTFGSHLANTLTNQGIPTTEYDELMKFVPGLTSVTNTFICDYFLPGLKMGLIHGMGHDAIKLNHAFRQKYMKRLRAGIAQLIRQATSPDSGSFLFIENSAWQIKRILIRDGHITATEGEKKRLAFEAEQHSDTPEEDRDAIAIILNDFAVNELYGK